MDYVTPLTLSPPAITIENQASKSNTTIIIMRNFYMEYISFFVYKDNLKYLNCLNPLSVFFRWADLGYYDQVGIIC